MMWSPLLSAVAAGNRCRTEHVSCITSAELDAKRRDAFCDPSTSMVPDCTALYCCLFMRTLAACGNMFVCVFVGFSVSQTPTTIMLCWHCKTILPVPVCGAQTVSSESPFLAHCVLRCSYVVPACDRTGFGYTRCNLTHNLGLRTCVGNAPECQ